MKSFRLICALTAMAIAFTQPVHSQGCDPINSLSAQVRDEGIELSWNYTPAAVSFFYDFEDGSLNP